MSKVIYHAMRDSKGDAVAMKVVDGIPTRLNPRYDLRNHSPDGFEWGYAGSGPAQLALAICADALGDDERAQEVYQDFKAAHIARYHRDKGFDLSKDQVLTAIQTIELKRSIPQ